MMTTTEAGHQEEDCSLLSLNPTLVPGKTTVASALLIIVLRGGGTRYAKDMRLHAMIVHLLLHLADVDGATVYVPAILRLVDQLEARVRTLWNVFSEWLIGIGGDVSGRLL